MHRLQPDSKRAVVQSYIEGLHWVLEYYYRWGQVGTIPEQQEDDIV